MDSPTLDDIAKESGCSRTTVSRALNGYSDVSESTRRKVLAVAHRLNYRPNAHARGLASNRSHSIAAVMRQSAFAETPIFIEVLESVRHTLGGLGYHLLHAAPTPEFVGIEDALSMYQMHKIDGVILLEVEVNDSVLPRFLDLGIPVVLFGQAEGRRSVPSVDVNGAAAMARVTRYLLDLGHRRIGYLSGPLKYVYAQHRFSGFEQVMTEAVGGPIAEWVVEVEGSLQSGYDGAARVLSMHRRPTAVICNSDYVALGAMKAIRDWRLRVPEDISVVGFDDVPVARFLSPPLTTVRQPTGELGRLLAEQMISAIERSTSPAGNIVLECDLVLRDSCARIQHAEE
ncbi:MAG: LacI family DNA-binding transcriptional regulator [Bacillota bacterium]|nr:LacI family DNA-binding transcriptional regulator [Bacillota bacterium]